MPPHRHSPNARRTGNLYRCDYPMRREKSRQVIGHSFDDTLTDTTCARREVGSMRVGGSADQPSSLDFVRQTTVRTDSADTPSPSILDTGSSYQSTGSIEGLLNALGQVPAVRPDAV